MSESPFGNAELIYTPAWWIPGGHLQTLWGKLFRRRVPVSTSLLRWDTPDGDFLEIHRLAAPADAPRLLVLHGLEGTVRSHYAQGLLGEAARRKWGADLLVFRSCGTEMNRTRRFYHSGETADIAFALDRIVAEFPHSPIGIVGVSLGGNVALRFLGERGADIPRQLKAAAAVSVPFDLQRSSRRIGKGFSAVYQHYFIRSLLRKTAAKRVTFPDLASPTKLDGIRTLEDFDNLVTAPLHGYRDAADYYQRASSLGSLPDIKIKTLLLSAVDDPMLPREVLDEVRNAAGRNPLLELEFVARGGHAGFVAGRVPWKPVYYAERRVGLFMAASFGRYDQNGKSER